MRGGLLGGLAAWTGFTLWWKPSYRGSVFAREEASAFPLSFAFEGTRSQRSQGTAIPPYGRYQGTHLIQNSAVCLVCLLQMPHQAPDEPRLLAILNQLNQAEMAADDRPPHFGAWCRGRLANGSNPAYVAFLPNVLHSHDGLALNASLWAERRAQIADAMLMLTASGQGDN